MENQQWLGKLQLSVFLNVVWVWTVLLLPLCDQIACYVRRPKSRCQSDLSTVSVLANRSLHQDLMHSGCRGTAAPKVCPQAFSLVPLPSSPLDQRPVHRLVPTMLIISWHKPQLRDWTQTRIRSLSFLLILTQPKRISVIREQQRIQKFILFYTAKDNHLNTAVLGWL